MEKETLEALKKSILKWKRIVHSSEALDRAEDNCPLCALFRKQHTCRGCPVARKAGKTECRNTPFEAWYKHFEARGHYFNWNEPNHRVPSCKKCMRLAKEELAFLKSLLPKGKKKC